MLQICRRRPSPAVLTPSNIYKYLFYESFSASFSPVSAAAAAAASAAAAGAAAAAAAAATAAAAAGFDAVLLNQWE